jgi:glutamyl-tRNA synthetase
MNEMIQYFNLVSVNHAPAAINFEKLLWLNQHYLKTENPDYVASALAKIFHQRRIDVTQGPALIEVVKALRERSKTLIEMADKAAVFYSYDVEYDVDAKSKFLVGEITLPFKFLHEQLSLLSGWNVDSINVVVKQCLEHFHLKMPQLAQPLRVALTGNIHSPSIDTTLFLTGQDRALMRIQTAMSEI